MVRPLAVAAEGGSSRDRHQQSGKHGACGRIRLDAVCIRHTCTQVTHTDLMQRDTRGHISKGATRNHASTRSTTATAAATRPCVGALPALDQASLIDSCVHLKSDTLKLAMYVQGQLHTRHTASEATWPHLRSDTLRLPMRLPLAGSVTPMLLLWSRAIWLSASSVLMLAGAVYTLPCGSGQPTARQHRGQHRGNTAAAAAADFVQHRAHAGRGGVHAALWAATRVHTEATHNRDTSANFFQKLQTWHCHVAGADAAGTGTAMTICCTDTCMVSRCRSTKHICCAAGLTSSSSNCSTVCATSTQGRKTNAAVTHF